MREIAQRLIAHETSHDIHTNTPQALLVCEKLRPHLAMLMGNAGFRALLLRALALSIAQAAILRALEVRADGSLARLDEVTTPADAQEFSEASVVLVSQLLGLLVAFIGEGLTVRLLGEVWPRLPLTDLNSGNGDTK